MPEEPRRYWLYRMGLCTGKLGAALQSFMNAASRFQPSVRQAARATIARLFSGFPMNDIAAHFADQGSLARVIPGFRARPQQVEMAEAIARAIKGNRALVAEAGTGTG